MIADRQWVVDRCERTIAVEEPGDVTLNRPGHENDTVGISNDLTCIIDAFCKRSTLDGAGIDVRISTIAIQEAAGGTEIIIAYDLTGGIDAGCSGVMPAADRRARDGGIVQDRVAAAAQQKSLWSIAGVVAAHNLARIVNAIGIGGAGARSIDGDEACRHESLPFQVVRLISCFQCLMRTAMAPSIEPLRHAVHS